ncbi:hypothetical protein NKH77_36130 [Streptomyces sp. M19]
MSGARIVLHLALELRRRGGGVGAAALCGGGGQGDALIVRVPRGRFILSSVRHADGRTTRLLARDGPVRDGPYGGVRRTARARGPRDRECPYDRE